MNELGLEKFRFETNKFHARGRVYNVTDIIELAKNLEPFDLVLKGIDLSVSPWGELDIKQYAEHMIRVNDADIQYPIILDESGYICDGWHRVVKAIVNGYKSIKAVRLTVMPDHVSVE